jgi:hypothetical protein
MTEYNENYDYSDHGQYDGTNETCKKCQDPDCLYYNDEMLCPDCLEVLFSEEIEKIAWEYLGMTDLSRSVTAMENEMGFMQVDILRSPLHADFIGFNLVFNDYEREISLMELEASARFIKGKKNNTGEIV